MNNYPPGVTGNEWQIQGLDEYEFSCPECSEPVTFYGDRYEAYGECEFCGHESAVSPDEVWLDEQRHRADEYRRDEKYGW